jgi:hypothetical protein
VKSRGARGKETPVCCALFNLEEISGGLKSDKERESRLVRANQSREERGKQDKHGRYIYTIFCTGNVSFYFKENNVDAV